MAMGHGLSGTSHFDLHRYQAAYRVRKSDYFSFYGCRRRFVEYEVRRYRIPKLSVSYMANGTMVRVLLVRLLYRSICEPFPFCSRINDWRYFWVPLLLGCTKAWSGSIWIADIDSFADSVARMDHDLHIDAKDIQRCSA